MAKVIAFLSPSLMSLCLVIAGTQSGVGKTTVTFFRTGEGYTWETQDRERDTAFAQQAWAKVSEFLCDPSYAMVILDEFNIALQHDYVRLEDVLPVLRARPPMQHVVITGRGAKEALIEAADLVTEMKQVKHPFRKGVKAQPGVEF